MQEALTLCSSQKTGESSSEAFMHYLTCCRY